MARTYPRTLLADDVKSDAEVRMFGILRDGLDDAWEVYHSVGWVRRDPGTGADDGEIDFVLVNPDEAIVCLEVKGGKIESKYGEWNRWKDGRRERMRDPFQQAIDHRYDLQRLIDDVDGWRGKDLLLVHALAFSDISVHSLALAPDAPSELIIDLHALSDIGGAMERVLAFHRGARDKRRTPGTAGAEMLRDLFAPTVRLEVPMAAAFLEEEQALVELTRDQTRVLSQLARNDHVAVHGCAGSGKTMLAVEHAKRLAAAGEDVLFVCFNKALASHLATTEKHERITFSNFHRLCTRYAYKANLSLPKYGEDPPAEYWRDELPELFVQAIDELELQWDALIVDEAQDLHDHWLDALRLALSDPEQGPVWLFLDDNQRIYEAGFEVPAGFMHWELATNCRTTQAIHRELLKLYDGTIVPDARGPEGRIPEFHPVADQPTAVASLLNRLTGADAVDPADVVVLSAHSLEGSKVGQALEKRFTAERNKRRGDQVLFSSIRAFKGLESPVVLMCELEGLDERTRNQQLYVGMSRARNHCLVVAPGPAT